MTGEWVITEGPTVERASIAALDALGVAADDAEIEVVAGARRGLFGIGGRAARVIARVEPVAPPGRIERSRNRPLKRRSNRDRRAKQRAQGQSSAKQAKARQPKAQAKQATKESEAQQPKTKSSKAQQSKTKQPVKAQPSQKPDVAASDEPPTRTRKLVS